MESIVEFVTTWWPWFVGVAAPLLFKVLNRLTPHFDDHTGVKRVLLIIVDVLDVLKLSKREDVLRVGALVGAICLVLAFFGGCVTADTKPEDTLEIGSMKIDKCKTSEIAKGSHVAATGATWAVCHLIADPAKRAKCIENQRKYSALGELILGFGVELLKACGL